jgi:tetratricopeptide (TPR) repeat protein
MAADDEPNQKPDENPGEIAPMREFRRAIEDFQKGAESRSPGQMEAAAISALTAATELAEKNPTPDLELKQRADDCESRGDWAGAEARYRQALEYVQSQANPGMVSKAHHDLGRLYQLIGELDKAEESARAAIAAARQARLFPLLVMGLELQASCALKRSDGAGALKAISEALSVIEPGPIYEGMRAGALVARARCRMASGDWAGAERDLIASKLLLLNSTVSPLFAGAHGRVAQWWEATAENRAHKGDLEGALEAWEEAVKSRRHVASLAHVSGPYTQASLADVLKKFGQACEAAGRTEDASRAMTESDSIRSELRLPEQ